MTPPNDHKADSPLRMGAYYYGFDATGIREIDVILSAIASAGKAYHHTDSWTEKCNRYHDAFRGETPVDWMQNAAADAATEITRLRSALTAAETALESAANALEEVGERTWDKRHHDDCKAACADASEMAGGARDEARTALADLQQARKQ